VALHKGRGPVGDHGGQLYVPITEVHRPADRFVRGLRPCAGDPESLVSVPGGGDTSERVVGEVVESIVGDGADRSVNEPDPDEWVPYELRHSFVSILSERGMPVEEISRLMGHKGTAVTELVYRHELRPVIESGASVMDSVFPLALEDAGEGTGDEEGDDDDAA
jgi:hypothetical protein